MIGYNSQVLSTLTSTNEHVYVATPESSKFIDPHLALFKEHFSSIPRTFPPQPVFEFAVVSCFSYRSPIYPTAYPGATLLFWPSV